MELSKEQLEYIQKPFRGFCPFCLGKNPRWTGQREMLKKIKYQCNLCGAEVVVKINDILSGNYKSANILVDNVGKFGKVYKRSKGIWITFQEFYQKSIIIHHYRRVKREPNKKGFPPSCRLCQYGENQSDGESTECIKFEFIGGADWICDAYVNDL